MPSSIKGTLANNVDPDQKFLLNMILIKLNPTPFLFEMARYKELSITKTCLYNFDPLKPHFYTVILGFTGVYIKFLISA